jgi:hypothetical protein
MVNECWKERSLTPSLPVVYLKTTHAEGQEEHPDREPHRHTHQQAHTLPNSGAEKIAQAQFTQIWNVIRYTWPPTPLSPKSV